MRYSIKKILVTGNLGYIGSVLTKELKKKYDVTGYDIGYFKNSKIYKFNDIKKQYLGDVNKIKNKHLQGTDCVIHLAGLSNDPLGEINHKLTYNTNYLGTKRLINLSIENNVKKFIFLSSQSIYGVSQTEKELDEFKSKKKPITMYAKSKWLAEKYLERKKKKIDITILRPSTVFGPSPRLRTDIVFNNFLANAYVNKKIELISNGKPWRPVIHIKDVCKAIILSIPKNNKENFIVYNLGIKNGNFTVLEIAKTVKKFLKKSKIIFLNLEKDPRSYKVSFKRIFKNLNKFNPKFNLSKGAKEMISFFKKINFDKKTLDSGKTVRITVLKKILNER